MTEKLTRRIIVAKIEQKESIKGRKTLFSKAVSVDSTSLHYVSGEFKGIGKNQSRVYLGIDHLWKVKGKKGCPLESMKEGYFYRSGEAVVVEKWDEEKLEMTADSRDRSKLKKWHNKGTEDQKRYLAIFFNGDARSPPDVLVIDYGNDSTRRGKVAGGYREVFPGSGIIQVSPKTVGAVKNKIKPGVTVVANHLSSSRGGRYNYVAASSEYVGSEWKRFEGTISGIAIGTFEHPNPHHFRPGATHARLVLLANYHQDDNSILEIRNVKFEKVVTGSQDETMKKKKHEKRQQARDFSTDGA